MTKTELAEMLAREHGSGILDDPMGIAEAMQTYDLVGEWQEMEPLIRTALAAPRTTEEVQEDRTRVAILSTLTGGGPYVLLSAARKEDGELRLLLDAGGDVQSREDIVTFLEAALRHLRED